MKSESNEENAMNLKVLVGQDELSNDLVLNIPKLSHLLIGGVSGSGKSNLLHRIISTLSSRISPENLKFILIDPKRIELNLYNGLPHLLTPVITDSKKAIMALKWVAKEMDRRLDILNSKNVRNIEAYHNIGPQEELMPYIIVVIDDLSFIMREYPKEFESAIIKMTQTSHLVGIHLIISTSQVINKVVTEPIKVGMKSRIAFKVSTTIDSKKILGMSGAERLQLEGEILFQSVSMKYPVCARLSEISENEINENLKIIKDKYGESALYVETVKESEGEDDLFPEARELVIEAGKASTSYLQRKLRIGYARSARLMDLLEEAGVIGKGSGAEPREVLKKEPTVSS